MKYKNILDSIYCLTILIHYMTNCFFVFTNPWCSRYGVEGISFQFFPFEGNLFYSNLRRLNIYTFKSLFRFTSQSDNLFFNFPIVIFHSEWVDHKRKFLRRHRYMKNHLDKHRSRSIIIKTFNTYFHYSWIRNSTRNIKTFYTLIKFWTYTRVTRNSWFYFCIFKKNMETQNHRWNSYCLLSVLIISGRKEVQSLQSP